MTELKPCPAECLHTIDRGPPSLFQRRSDIWGVYCQTCRCSTEYYGSEAEAIAAWNMRAVPCATGDDGELVGRSAEVRSELWAALIGNDQSHKDLIDRIEALTAENEKLRKALTDIGVYGCGMLNQLAAMNGPEEAWLRLRRIREMENVARAALKGTEG